MNRHNASSEGCITLIQHNANKCSIAHHTILHQGFERSTDIILLQEPYCPKFDGVHIGLQHPAYHLILPISDATPSNIPIRPRVLVYIRKAKNLIYTPRYDLCNDPDMQVLEVIGLEPFLVYNIYNERERDYGLVPSQDASRSCGDYTVDRLLLNTCLQAPSILVGDFNLHHPRWNSAASLVGAAKASSLVNWLDSQRATMLVDPEVVNESGGTYNRSDLRNISVIDLTFYTPFKKLAWTGWSYIDGTGSDHEAIAFEARPVQPPTSSTPSDTRTPRFNYKLADWEKYSKQLNHKKVGVCQQIDSLLATRDYDGIATTITNAIMQSAENAIPRLKVCERSKPWWTPELNKMRKDLTSALRHYKKHRTGQSEEEYKVKKKILTSIV